MAAPAISPTTSSSPLLNRWLLGTAAFGSATAVQAEVVQIDLAGPELGALPIGGSFRAENVDAFVRLLASSGDIAYERVSDHRVVLRSVR
jgi:hypothetical protein